MNVFIWMLAGAALGWLTFHFLDWSSGRGKMASIMLGGMGGIFGGKMLGGMFAGVTPQTTDFSLGGMFCALFFAAVILVAANMIFSKWKV
jgi:uncharacterized membrane protein YeaQ/YmgE (transglycosylase-associated protein family)